MSKRLKAREREVLHAGARAGGESWKGREKAAMGDKSKIEWTDATWPVVVGCDRVSSGCAHCYAIREVQRLAANPTVGATYQGLVERQPNGQLDWTGTIRCLPERLELPLKWKRPRMIFVNSMSDLFHEQVPFDFIAQVWGVMWRTPHHVYQILTKRPQRMLEFTTKWYSKASRLPGRQLDYFSHVWLGVSVENQQAADERIPLLLQTPAAVRFLSCEPLLGSVDLSEWFGLYEYDEGRWALTAGSRWDPSPDWVIVGGESGGPHARPMRPDWARSIRDQCVSAGVPFFFKQAGSVLSREWGCPDSKGGDIDYFPADLRIRDYPDVAVTK